MPMPRVTQVAMIKAHVPAQQHTLNAKLAGDSLQEKKLPQHAVHKGIAKYSGYQILSLKHKTHPSY
jgi:hypothetical protein